MNGSVDTVQMIASDVVALFPIMEAGETARVCAEMVETSELEFEDLDLQEMLLYIKLNADRATNIGSLQSLLPRRAKMRGGHPTMRNRQVRAPSHQNKIEEDKLICIHKEVP